MTTASSRRIASNLPPRCRLHRPEQRQFCCVSTSEPGMAWASRLRSGSKSMPICGPFWYGLWRSDRRFSGRVVERHRSESMTDGQDEFEGTPENTIEDRVFDEFVEDIRRWRRHADLDEKADD